MWEGGVIEESCLGASVSEKVYCMSQDFRGGGSGRHVSDMPKNNCVYYGAKVQEMFPTSVMHGSRIM